MNFLKKGISFGIGLAVTSKEQIEKVVDDMVKKGEVAPEESKKVVDQLVDKGEQERQKLNQMMKDQMHDTISGMNVPTKDDLTKVENKLADLDQRIRQLEEHKSEE